MYRSPIEIVYQNPYVEIEKKLDSDIYTAVMKYGINVDKEELIRALKYDRDQYNKGYADGRADAMAEIVRCKDCKWRCRNPAHKEKHCVLSGLPINDDDYCSNAERWCEAE